MKNFLFVTLLLTLISPVLGQETLRPVSVAYCSGPNFVVPPNDKRRPIPTYIPANAIDGNPDTYCCMLDDTPTGTDTTTKPPKGNDPVTGYMIFDFGQTKTLYGFKLMSPKKNRYIPRKIDVLCIEDGIDPHLFNQYEKLAADPKSHCVQKGIELPHRTNGDSAVLTFKPVAARYLAIKVFSAWDYGLNGYYIYQMAEFNGLGCSAPPDTLDLNKIVIDGESLASLINSLQEVNRRNTDPYTISRLHRDWIYQDHGLDYKECFSSGSSNNIETAMVRKVLDELAKNKVETVQYENTFKELVTANVPGRDARWSSLYWQTCELRRQNRLKVLSDSHRKFVYAKHYVVGGRGGMMAMTADLTDTEKENRGPDWRVGAELVLLSVAPDGKLSQEILLGTDKGIIRDPAVSFDGKKIAFAMKVDQNDDYHLYVMDIATRKYEQITFGTATADYEPCFLQSGDLVFNSTRCDQSAPCFWSNVSNLYTCDIKGRFLRRLTFDTAHNVTPSVLDNGQVVYCRWEYNDRNVIFNEPLMVMNPDGTSQTEYYGNNSWCPTSIIHARGIPDSSKVIAIETGHHSDQSGKMIIIDRTKGTQEEKGLKYASPERPFFWEINDRSGCDGELFQYPYALDEENYLASYLPEGNPNKEEGGRRHRYDVPFGIYWMDRLGRRELLVYDPTISSGQIMPLASREKVMVKSTSVDFKQNEGTFFVQNVYIGPGLEGIPKGTVKKLRIVGLEARAMSTTHSVNKFYGEVTTPVSILNGSWDVKHVLGTVNVEEDGSAFFTAPARTPLYFQLLDEKGYVVQTMRSWAMVMPGENFGCVGCHEDKNTSYFTPDQKQCLATMKPPQKPVPFYKPGEEPVQEQLARMTESERKAWHYLSVNAPQGTDRPRGFSYLREIQPILDDHCVSCHNGTPNAKGQKTPMNLLGNAKSYTTKEVWLPEYTFVPNKQKMYRKDGGGLLPGRDFAVSYLNLTNYGKDNELTPAFLATSDPPMIKPRSYGSSQSKLMQYLEPTHYNVKLTREEKELVACWIDLCVPFCGSYMEANHWDKIYSPHVFRSKELRGIYLYHEAKRLKHAEVEIAHLEKYQEYLKSGHDFTLTDFPVFTFGGVKKEGVFIAETHSKPAEAPIYGAGENINARGGSNIAGNPRRNLAINPKASTFSITSYPHASSNSHWKYWDSTSPKLVIDGLKDQSGHGWRPNKRTDLWLKIEFGRQVKVDEVVLTLKLAEHQKKTWNKAVLTFSDGSEFPINLACTADLQRFPFPAKTTSSITLTKLSEEMPLSNNGVLEFEVMGRDCE